MYIGLTRIYMYIMLNVEEQAAARQDFEDPGAIYNYEQI